jgi:SHS2 domain-containing protein
MRYKFVDHMADIEFIAYGKTDEELFSNALSALFETVADTRALSRSSGKKVKVTVKEKADSLEELLWYTLQHTLSITESRRVFAYEIAEIKIAEEGGKFSCELKAYAKEKMDEHSKLAAKGISKYGLKITKGEVSEARVVIDV